MELKELGSQISWQLWKHTKLHSDLLHVKKEGTFARYGYSAVDT